MEFIQALKLLTALSSGINPITAEAFPAESPYQHPDIVRALFLAVRALEAARDEPSVARPVATPATSTGAPNRPGKAGKPWSQAEDDELLAGYDAGQTNEALAATHQRSRLGVEARLARHGRVPMPAGVRSMNGLRTDSDPHRAMEEPSHAPYGVRDAARVGYRIHV
ncbi:MAG: hypothetical protein EXR39_12965 [Betaproteobacteria bacterium]|nr:hypothetical protein [Betaproteobacteria bacterium]